MYMEPTSPLVTAEWLREHLDSPDLVILDASYFLPAQKRDARQEYEEKHIPGARFFDIDAISDKTNPLPHMLPSKEFFNQSAGQMGIGNHTLVVVYDNNDFMASARVWWTFRVFGHKRVRVLNGGLHHWLAQGSPIQADTQPITTQTYQCTYHPSLVRNLDAMLGQIDSQQAQIIDARPPGRFRGEEPEPRPGLRPGHIPGSRNLFYKCLIDDNTHTLKPVQELEQIFRNAGIDPSRPVTATCGSGVTAAILALGLYCLKNDIVAVYDGSWTEWGQHPKTPTAMGPNPIPESP